MNVLFTLLSAFAAFVTTLSAGFLIKKFKKNIGVVCAFSAGFFISLSLFDVLPSIIALAPETQIPFEFLFLSSFLGFSIMLIINRGLSAPHLKDHHATNDMVKQKIGLLSTLEFCSHAVLEGIAVGVSFQLQFGLGIFVTLAVISHDFCDGISTLALMLNSGNTLKSSMKMLVVDAFAPVLGAVSTLFFTIQGYFLVYALSFLLGTFLYIGGGTLLPDAYRMNRRVVTLILFLIGFFLVFFLTRILA